jgi:hemoglobin
MVAMIRSDPGPSGAIAPPDPERIAALVDRFYDRIRVHPTLGPVFNAAVHDWPEHNAC